MCESKPGPDLIVEIEQFLFREARLLDEERYQEWLDLLSEGDGFEYWMPVIESRDRRDPVPAYERGRLAIIETDDKRELAVRAKALEDPANLAQNPPTLHMHLVCNVEVECTDDPHAFRVHSVVLYFAGRYRGSEDVSFALHARREDLLRRGHDGLLRIARRTILLRHTILPTGALTTFL
ncbi:aromatic-ring-hydroxylating dioxygenase subunit beta [Streptomyces botrytidirepellens]|uniref:3-phenylpropionate dioxygenase n=1 Tax=Streptomyces botrytidirepellens TaxID=2486417 RepID=A0A3M8VV42_9ACTN|nr:aromatic-ring-hydroxylating dioxygenase subunit beta [Streptomyces botrytidirepellens]RNG21614.1 3-phenylpropionate dioxygenase [Streptomyces botrytidirepellens]